MSLIITIAVLFAYFVFFHDKLMDKLGMDKRDMNFVYVGFMLNIIFDNVIKIVKLIASGGSIKLILIQAAWIALSCWIMKIYYKSANEY